METKKIGTPNLISRVSSKSKSLKATSLSELQISVFTLCEELECKLLVGKCSLPFYCLLDLLARNNLLQGWHKVGRRFECTVMRPELLSGELKSSARIATRLRDRCTSFQSNFSAQTSRMYDREHVSGGRHTSHLFIYPEALVYSSLSFPCE